MQNRGRAQAQQNVVASGRALLARRGKGTSGGGIPTRTCVVCRKACPTIGLLQLKGVASSGRGRSAYVCIAPQCLRGVHGGMLGKALKGNARLDGATLEAELQGLAQTKIVALLGLARRCGDLVIGVEGLLAAASEGDSAAVPVSLMGTDLAPRSARKLPQAQVFLTSQELGRAVGREAVGALGIRSGRLAMQAAYWLRVWYATQHQLGTD